MFGMLAGAFGLGQALGGLFASGQERRVTDAQNEFTQRVADLNAKRQARGNRYQFGMQRVQNAGMGNNQSGSVPFIFADDARKAQENITQIRMNASNEQIANSSQVSSTTDGLIGFGASALNFGLKYGPTIRTWF